MYCLNCIRHMQNSTFEMGLRIQDVGVDYQFVKILRNLVSLFNFILSSCLVLFVVQRNGHTSKLDSCGITFVNAMFHAKI